MTTDNGDNWVAKNKGIITIMSPDTIISALTVNGNNIFAGTWIDGIFRSTDKGKNWVRKSNGIPFVVKMETDTGYNAIVNVIIMSDDTIYAGTSKGVYKSTNNGENWILKNNGLPQVVKNTPIDTFIHIESMAKSGNNIFAGTRRGVFMSTDNGDYWTAKNKSMENMAVYSLAVNGNNIYAGTEFGGVYLSTDNGDNWKKNDSLYTKSIASIIIKGNNIFVGGYGVYLSTDNGNSWTFKNSGLPSMAVGPLIINGDYIFAGIDNAGIYRAKLSDLGITDVKEQGQTNENKIYPNPASNEIRLKFHSPVETEVQISVFDLLGNKVLSRTEQATEAENEKTINCEKLPQGYYYVKININEIVQTIPLVIIK
jgi:photosystem II stability/assembly factor-like uncharacterized protein